MGEPVGEIAVVRQEKQPLGVEVEPPDGKDTPPFRGQKLRHRGAILSLFVPHGGEYVARLVQGQIDGLLAPGEELSPDLDGVPGGVGQGPHLFDDLAVDRHRSGADEALGFAPGGDARLGDDLLNANGGHLCDP